MHAIQDKWLKVWTDLDPFKAVDDGSRERRYLLDMFPYPSGDLPWDMRNSRWRT